MALKGTLPTCKRCGRPHPNFLKECPPPPQPVPMAGPNAWGTPWGNARQGAEVVYRHKLRRTGSITVPDRDEPTAA